MLKIFKSIIISLVRVFCTLTRLFYFVKQMMREMHYNFKELKMPLDQWDKDAIKEYEHNHELKTLQSQFREKLAYWVYPFFWFS